MNQLIKVHRNISLLLNNAIYVHWHKHNVTVYIENTKKVADDFALVIIPCINAELEIRIRNWLAIH